MPNIAPFEIPYNIVLDGNGNGQYVQQFANDYYYGATVSGLTGGTPMWALLRNSIFFKPAVGAAVAMSAGINPPGTQLTVRVSGGIPNASVTGYIYGLKSNDPSTLAVAMVDIPQSPGIVQVPQRFQLKAKASDPSPIYTVPYDGNTYTFTFQIPPGALTARWYFTQPPGTPSAVWTILAMNGDQSAAAGWGYANFNNAGGSTTNNISEDLTARLWPIDTQIIITAQFPANGTTAAPFKFMVEASLMQDLVKASIAGEGTTLAANNIGIFDNGALVVRQLTNMSSTAWQQAQFSAPLVGGIAAGGSVQIVAPPGANQAIYLYEINILPGTAGTFGKVTDGTTQYAEWGYAGGQAFPMRFYAKRFPTNTGVTLTNDGPALTSEAGNVVWSVGP